MRVELSQECNQGPSYANIWGKVQSLSVGSGQEGASCLEWRECKGGGDVIKKVKGLMKPDNIEPCDSL